MKVVLKALAKSKTAWAVSCQLSRILACTNIGIQFHWDGYKRMKDARKIYVSNNNCKNPEITEEFHREGSARKKESYNPKLIKTIQTKFSALMEDESAYTCDVSADYQGPKDVRRVLKDPFEKLPELALLIDDNVKAQIEDFYGAYFSIPELVVWRNYHVPEEYAHHEALSNFWHFDQISTSLFQMFVNISDVTEDDGPFHAQPKGRSDELMRMGFKGRKNYNIPLEELENAQYVRKHIGAAGTVMYCKTPVCLHRADIPKEDHYRDLISFHIMPSDKPLSDNWAKEFSESKKR